MQGAELSDMINWNVLGCPSGPGSLFLEETMAEKVFKTHSELIDLLSQRGMVFSSPRSKGIAKKTLQREGYYNLINGYKDMFLTSSDAENFLPGTTIEEFVALYNFDRDLREIFLKT